MNDDALSDLIFGITGPIATPCHQLETLIFQTLNLPTSTTFRMFPPPDIDPLNPKCPYPTSAKYTYALLQIMLIPCFVYMERRRSGGSALGTKLIPLTGTAGLVAHVVFVFARVWLAAAWLNAALAQVLEDGCVWRLFMNFVGMNLIFYCGPTVG